MDSLGHEVDDGERLGHGTLGLDDDLRYRYGGYDKDGDVRVEFLERSLDDCIGGVCLRHRRDLGSGACRASSCDGGDPCPFPCPFLLRQHGRPIGVDCQHS
mgnify:CR=1 FL=1